MVLLFKILNRKCSCPLIFRNLLSKIFRKSKMGCAPHHLASQGAGCRSCLKRQFGKKSPQGEALTKARGSRDFGAVPGFQKTSYAPHQSTLLTASPRGEAKIRQNFNLPSIGAARHFPRKGKARGKRGK